MNFSPAADSITVTTNGSLRLYVGSATAVMPNLVNSGGTPASFAYFGLPSNTSISQKVNADFAGTIYAPNAAYTLGGNGSGTEQKLTGAIIVKSLSYNDFFSFHYDMYIGRMGLSRGYLMASWAEL